LAGKTALVTGAGRGIGLAVAKGLAGQGADVALVARTESQLTIAKEQIESQTGRKVWVFPFDLGDVGHIAGLFDRAVRATGGVDILVNCAGTTVREPSEDASLESFNRVMDVNLTEVLLLCQAFCRHRKQVGKPGRIINIGSLA